MTSKWPLELKKGTVQNVLCKCRVKMEGRTKNPWFDMQRTYYYKNKTGIQTLQQLRLALEHFHIRLAASELEFLMESFPASRAGGFNFRNFAASLYPRDIPVPDDTIGGRSDYFIRPPSPDLITMKARKKEAELARQQQPAFSQQQEEYPPELDFTHQLLNQYKDLNVESTGPFGPQEDVKPVEATSRLGTGLGMDGATFYWEPRGPGSSSATRHQSPQSLGPAPMPGTKRMPRVLKQNRFSHQQFHDTRFMDQASSVKPVPQAFPAGEFRGQSLPRFKQRKGATYHRRVEISRHSNISRGYN